MHRIGDIVKILRHPPAVPRPVPRGSPFLPRPLPVGGNRPLCYCAFCGCPETEAPVVAGPSCFICSRCVVRSVSALLTAGHRDFLEELAARLERQQRD